MDEFIGFMMVAFLVVAAVTIYLGLCAALALATTIVFGVESLIVAFRGFGLTIGRGIRFQGGDRAAPDGPEPAYVAYFLGPFWSDFQYALTVGLEKLGERRQELFQLGGQHMSRKTWPIGVGAGFGAIAGYAFALVVGALIAIPVTIFVLLTLAAAWVSAGALRLYETVRMRLRGAHYECPEDHERFILPVYVCPACGAKHEQLLPGRYGILHRTCACDRATIPTLRINGRNKVPMECPDGHSLSGAIGIAQNLPIPIAGGPSSGKSSYLAGAMIELEQLQASQALAMSVIDQSRSGFDTLTTSLRQGIRPQKTTDEQAPALVAEIGTDGPPRLLFAYDVAGEGYVSSDKVRSMKFLARSVGLVLLVDPLAIPRVREEHEEEIESLADALRPSSENPERVFERIVGSLRESGCDDLKKLPLAVVVTKADAIGIEDQIAELAETDPETAPRQWLELHGGGNLVRAISQEFGQVGWFACSALGRTPVAGDASPFVPRGVVEPMLWILRQKGVVPRSSAAPLKQTVTDQYAEEASTSELAGAKLKTPRPQVALGTISPLTWEARLGWGGLVASLVVVLALLGAAVGATG